MVGGGLVCAGGLWLERETVLTCEPRNALGISSW